MGVLVPLSTFNSKTYIGKVILSFAVFIGGYGIFLSATSISITTGQNQYQENRLKAEKYIFKQPSCVGLILGSSLSDGLKEEYFDGSVCNLAFGGGSSLWGGALAMALPQRPQVVLIEANVLVDVNQEFLNALLGDPDYSLKKMSPIFLQASQPVTQLLNWLRQKNPPKAKTLDPEQVETWVKYYTEAYNQFGEGEQKMFQKSFKALEKLINEMKTAGIKIIFFQMPTDLRLKESKKMRWEQEQWSRFAQQNQISFLQLPFAPEMKTKDGLHLEDSSLKSLAPMLLMALRAQIRH